jgi:D-beta-D-heptose 7-phosphate kinase/D-beta-D-heptose 1-phosphate adenosyltransferase
VQYLQEARALGDVLVVGLNSDASVTRLKGPLRPLVPAMERAQLMAALRSVDFVTIFEEDTAVNLIAALRPDIYVKGGDYEVSSEAANPTGKVLPEAATVQSYGGKIQLIPFLPNHSTTGLIKKIVAAYSFYT